MLACAQTTLDESCRFKMHPWVCSYDVSESLNNEKRSFFMGLEFFADGTSNCHTHVFIPSCQRQIFIWVAKKVLPILHGSETISRVIINLFDEAINEYGPFEQSMSAKIRLCQYHHSSQKTSGFKKHAKNDTEKKIFDDFKTLTNCIAESVESKKEHDFIMNLIEIHIDNYKNEMNDNLVDSFMKQLSAVSANEQRYSNHIHFNMRNLHKKLHCQMKFVTKTTKQEEIELSQILVWQNQQTQ